ncbi:MAG: hypothetical protein ACRD68_03800 [Pyrinomonadaceae bacterium]
MPSHGDGSMQIVELVTVEADRLLTAPAEPFSPCGVAEGDALLAAEIFDTDLDLLVCLS